MNKHLTQRQLINILLIIALLLLSGSIYLAYYQVNKLKNSSAWLIHTYEVLAQTNKVHLALTQAELLTHDYLDLHDNQSPQVVKLKIKEAEPKIAELYRLTADNPSQKRNIDRLSPLITQKINLLQTAFVSPQMVTSIAARAQFSQNLRDINSKLDEAISDVQEVELVLLGVRNATYQMELNKTNLTLFIAGILGNGLLLLAFLLLNRYLHQRNVAEDEREKSESNLKRIIDSSHDLIAAVDTNLRFTAFNSAYEKSFHHLFNRDIKTGMRLQEVLPQSLQADAIMKTWQRALTGDAFTITHRFDNEKAADIGSYYYETTYNTIYDTSGKLIGACHIMRDVTERHKLEQMKNEFVSMFSHELRMPLTSIRSSLGLISGGVLGQLDDKTHNMLNIAYNNCSHLLNLINDMVEIEQIETGKLAFHLETLDLNQLIEEAVIKNKDEIQAAQVAVRTQLETKSCLVQGDHQRLLQVLDNLIGNAIKYTKKNTEILVTTEIIADKVRVSVKDQGEGVPEESQQYIFEKFSQANSSLRKAGTGLDLSISKAIIVKHHGHMDFVSTTNEGATFYFELPLLK